MMRTDGKGDERIRAEEQASVIQAALGPYLLGAETKSRHRLYLAVDSASIREVTEVLANEHACRFQTASAVDAPNMIEILYHWAVDTAGLVVTIRTNVDRQRPDIESIADICPAAEWVEREMWELMGIAFKGHPEMRHLLLQDDWPKDKYPLRRDFRRD